MSSMSGYLPDLLNETEEVKSVTLNMVKINSNVSRKILYDIHNLVMVKPNYYRKLDLKVLNNISCCGIKKGCFTPIGAKFDFIS